jgi:hypothetical protein
MLYEGFFNNLEGKVIRISVLNFSDASTLESNCPEE